MRRTRYSKLRATHTANDPITNRVDWRPLVSIGTVVAAQLLQGNNSTVGSEKFGSTTLKPPNLLTGGRWLNWVIPAAAVAYGGYKLLKNLPDIAPAAATQQQLTETEIDLLVEHVIDKAVADAYEIVARRQESAGTNGASVSVWTAPPDAQWLQLAPHPSVNLIIGKRGSGKSALGYRQLELYRNQATPYVVGLPPSARKLLPEWIGIMDRLEDVPPGAAVLLDEAYVGFHARNSMSKDGRDIGTLVNLSRQRGQTLIFIVQEARQLDVNAISQADVIAIKELTEISRGFERRELRPFTDKARTAFTTIRGDKRRWTWVYSEVRGEGSLLENQVATFWKPALSRAFAGAGQSDNDGIHPPRRGERTPREQLAARAKKLRTAGLSYGNIAKTLGIAKSSAHDLVKGHD